MHSTLFIAAIILGAVLVFIILFIVLHKRSDNKKLAMQKVIFADIVWKNKFEISQKEIINDYLLAIDKINFVLLYVNFSEPKEEVVIIDLWNIRTVKFMTEDNNVHGERKGKAVLVDKQVNKLQLEVVLVDNEKINLVLYQYKDGVQDLIAIKTRANYWAGIINSAVKELPHAVKQMPSNMR
jgi:hypothetical protein